MKLINIQKAKKIKIKAINLENNQKINREMKQIKKQIKRLKKTRP